jgi:Tfp pilus assembly protein FimT
MQYRCAQGAALLDVIVTCGLVAILASVAIPSLRASQDRDAALLAARHLASRLNLVRIEALRRNRLVALRFDPEDIGRVAAYVDGDGDGVREQDVAAGIDAGIESATHVKHHFSTVAFRVAADVPAPDGNGMVVADSDTVRIGKSNFVSFSPSGSCTSGTIYLAGDAGTQVAVRIFGATGRIRVLRFDPGTASWSED